MLHSLRLAIARTLLRMAAGSNVQRHLAYWLAGLAGWVRLLPRIDERHPVTLKECVTGIGVLLGFLALIGPVLRGLTPVLHWVGGLPVGVPVVAVLLLVNGWRYWVGRCALSTLPDVFRATAPIFSRPRLVIAAVPAPELVPFALTRIARAVKALFRSA